MTARLIRVVRRAFANHISLIESPQLAVGTTLRPAPPRRPSTKREIGLIWERGITMARVLYMLLMALTIFEASAEGVGHPPPCGQGETQVGANRVYRYSFYQSTGPFSAWVDVGTNAQSARYACQVLGPPIAQANDTCQTGYTCTNYRGQYSTGTDCDVVMTRTNIATGQTGTYLANNGDTLKWQDVPGVCVANEDRKELGPQQCDSASTPHPINVLAGNKILEVPLYRGKGVFPIEVTRRYNSYAHLGGYLPGTGPGFFRQEPNWRMSYDISVVDAPNEPVPGAYVWRPDGRVLFFTKVGSDYVADNDINLKLERTSNQGVWTGWRVTNERDEIEVVDTQGYLQSVTNRAGLSHTFTYDGSGRVIGIAHSFGHQVTLTQTTVPTSMVIPGGGTYSFGYDALQNLASITFPDLTQRTFVYANTQYPRAVTSQLDENAVTHGIYNYQADGKVYSSELAGGVSKYSVVYTSPTRSTVTDPLLKVRTYDHSQLIGTPKATAQSSPDVNCGGMYKSRQYDARGNSSTLVDFSDVPTLRSFNARNLIESKTDASGTAVARTTTTQWHPTFRLPTQIDEPGKRTTLSYDAQGNVLTRTELDTNTSESRTWTYTYNTSGQVLTADGPRTDVYDITSYSYYTCTTGGACGQLQTVTDPLGHVTTYQTYNAHGQPLQIIDPNNVWTTLTYDGRQRLASRTVGGETTTYSYWPTGLLKRVTQPDGSYLEYSYDNAHRLTQIVDGENNRIVYTLDNMGNRTKEERFDPSNTLSFAQNRTYDQLNQLNKVIGAANTVAVTTTLGYDNNGNQTTTAAPLGRNTTNAYDALNRLKQVTDAANGVTQYGYNALDQLISVTDPRNLVTSYQVNAFGDVTQLTSPDTGVTQYQYDAAGNRTQQTDARSKVAVSTYDAKNRVIGITYADQIISFGYDAGTYGKDRLSSIIDGSGSTSWTYTPQGRVATRTQVMGTMTKTVSYVYDTSGRLQSLTLPSGAIVTYGYTQGRVSGVAVNSSVVTSGVLYEPFGSTRGWAWGNGTFAIRSYTTDGNVSQIDSNGLKTYSYDNAFRITGITDAQDATRSWTYGYDLLDRLTSATRTGQTQGWTYDGNGNRLSETGTTPSTFTVSSASNRLTAVSGTVSRTYGYDAAGNTTADGGRTFTYNDAGRMTTYVKDAVTTTLTYNALGQRVTKSNVSGTHYFVYDESGHLLGEYDASGAVFQETVWMGDIPIAALWPDGSGGVTVTYVHTDHLNTPRAITRTTDNAVLWRWRSDPFGTDVAEEDVDGDSVLARYYLRFPGQFADVSSGLNYNYFRDYDPTTGKYVESDPIGLKGGVNTYAYVGGNPASLIDPAGLAVWICKRDVDVSWLPDMLARGLPSHAWIKTDTREAGMGGRCPVPGEQCSDRPYSDTQVKDHSGQSKQPGVTCTLQLNVDEGCVNRNLTPGKPTGTWNLYNQCNSWAYGVVGSCRYGPQSGPRLPPSLLPSRGSLGSSFGP